MRERVWLRTKVRSLATRPVPPRAAHDPLSGRRAADRYLATSQISAGMRGRKALRLRSLPAWPGSRFLAGASGLGAPPALAPLGGDLLRGEPCLVVGEDLLGRRPSPRAGLVKEQVGRRAADVDDGH